MHSIFFCLCIFFIVIFIGKTEFNLAFCHDPEKILGSSLLDDKREVETEFVTKATFVKGLCANKLHKDLKPRIFYLTNQSITNHNGIPSVAAALKQCLENHDKNDIVILCSSLIDVGRSITALNVLGEPSEEYVPYLKDKVPSIQDKKELLKSSAGSILVSDYRSVRGCEASHCIILTSLTNPIAGTIMAEMLSRAMVNLDFIVLPKTDAVPSVPNPIQMAFDTWLQRGLVESTIVEFHDEDESTVTFNLQQSTQMKSVEIEIIGFDFDLSHYILNEQSENHYK